MSVSSNDEVIIDAKGKWKVVYFDIPNRGEQLRLLFKFAKVSFIDERLDLKYKQFEAMKKESIGDDSPLLYNQIPIVVSPEGKTYAQTAACMQLLGHALPNLAPKDKETDATCLGIVLASEELRNQCFYKLFMAEAVGYIAPKKAAICCCAAPLVRFMKGTNKHKKVFGKLAKHFDDMLRLSGLRYFASNTQAYYCDIAVFDSIHSCLDLPCFDRDKELKAFPSLKKWFDHMDGIPQLKAYLEERGTVLEYLWRKMSEEKKPSR